ncbi:MAG TPA: hypothetical protein VN289_08210 [Paraburkholderia sp.]|jgi:hypothetical protein|nr:hypothetical protein [Paraburkholderia sp.]
MSFYVGLCWRFHLRLFLPPLPFLDPARHLQIILVDETILFKIPNQWHENMDHAALTA